jgi:hypothetical protein
MTQPETFDKVFEIDCVLEPRERQKHIDSAVARKLRVVVKRKERKGKVAIVASGPSATDYVPICSSHGTGKSGGSTAPLNGCGTGA